MTDRNEEISTLLKLKEQLEQKIYQLQQEEQDETLRKFSGGKCKNIKEEAAAMVKELKTFLNKEEFVLNVPIRFTVFNETEIDLQDYALRDDHIDSIVNFVIEGNIDSSAKLDRTQRMVLQSGLDEVLNDACEAVMRLLPQQLREQKSAMQKKLQKWQTNLRNFEKKIGRRYDLE